MNIDGLSEATLEKFISCGFIHDFTDLFHLERHEKAIVSMEGFGEKSYRNLIASVEKDLSVYKSARESRDRLVEMTVDFLFSSLSLTQVKS